ncbi:MAG: SpoIVB peptidase S55 domain-containing protein [Acidobacteriaceae bacterium]
MSTSRISTQFSVLTAVFAIAGTLGAQVTPAVAPSSATAGVYPLSEVHRGLHGVAYTVFEGTQPEAMDVEILGVLKNVLGPDQDMILARLHGSKPEYTGVVAGMSGSPVYIDGKLLGALSYRIGQFSKEPIAGITPIAEMLAVNGTAEPEIVRPGVRDAVMWSPQGSSSSPTPVADATDIHPIETPLVLSGFSPEAVKFFQDHVSVMGLMPVAGLGGNASDSTHMDSSPLLPGSAVSALLVRGDLEIAATCTVTYVDPHQILACGHPITRYGNVSIPMTKADVVATLASPLNSFKIVNTTQTIGAFTEDRSSAIRGVPGESARMIPVAIHTHGGLHERTLHMEVVDNPDITPGAVMVSLYESLLETNSYSEELTYELRGTVAIDGYPPLHLNSLIAPTEQLPSALRAALTVGQRFQAVYGNSARVRNIQRIDLDIDSLPGRRSIQLERAQATQPAAHPGDTVMVEATLRPFRGETRNLRIPITLPQTLNPGPLRILFSDGATLDRLTTSSSAEGPMELTSIIHEMNAAHEDDRLYVTLLLPNAQAVVDGRTLASIPISMANVLEPLRTNRGISLNGESVVPVTSIPVEAMLTGMQVVSLEIE